MKLYYRDIRIDMRGDSPATAQKLAAAYLIERYVTEDSDEIQRGEHGKPFLPENVSMKFNLSHGGNYAVLAVSDKEIGVDIESLSRKANIDKIAKRVFTEAEQAYIKGQDTLRFFQIWTAKEAVMKATGLGFTLYPLSFSVIPFNKLCEADDKLWDIKSNIHDGHMVSIAELSSSLRGAPR
jgi:phosphopantetheinyl transferase